MSERRYRERAEAFAPKTAEEIARTARQLAANGFSDSTIGAILKIDTSSVWQLLGECSAAQMSLFQKWLDLLQQNAVDSRSVSIWISRSVRI